MPRRGNGEGTLFQRPDGRWCAALTIANGRRRYYYGRTRADVQKKLTAALHQRDTGVFVDVARQSVGDYLDFWLREVVRPSVRPFTYRDFEIAVRKHLKPAFGNVALDRLSPGHVQSLMNAQIKAGVSPKYVKNIRGILRNALNDAVKWGLLSRNVATLVDPPKAERFEIVPMTPDEARRFLDAVKGDRLEALYTVALTLGLRQAEALGLRWEDVDLEAREISVRKQLQRIDRKFELLDLKTQRSRRTLAIPASLAIGLGEHRRRQLEERLAAGKDWLDWGLVFTTDRGLPLEASTVLRYFHRHLDDAGLPQRRFHDLRHSCATLLLVQGIAPRVVMEILGHSDISMTMNTYSHVIPELRRQAADRLDDLLSGRER